MSRLNVVEALEAAQRIQADLVNSAARPSEVEIPTNQPVLPHSLFRDTRGYMEKIVYQVNHCYETTCYDACAVMIRRLAEVLIIEAFEHTSKAAEIKDSDDNYCFLEELVKRTLAQSAWSLSRNTKAALRKLKRVGDQSAHSRRYNARRSYIDDLIIDLRTMAEELLYIAGLRT